MKRHPAFLPAALAAASLALITTSSGAPLVNLGLVGVGRVPADAMDQTGTDTLGGIGSAIVPDLGTLTRNGPTCQFTAHCLPDRGLGAGYDFHPRIHTFAIAVTPFYGPYPAPAQDQISLVNLATLVLNADAQPFTGDNPDDATFTAHPKSSTDGPGQGKWSLDPEGLARAADGSFYVCDEYAPFVYHFNSAGQLLDYFVPPDAYIPKTGASYPRAVNYGADPDDTTDSGRYDNRGFEGVTLTPDQKRLVTIMQAPLVQDGNKKNGARNCRILVMDLDPASATCKQWIGEYILRLEMKGNAAGTKNAPASEILALTDTQFLVIERDGIGAGGDPGPTGYKNVNLIDLAGASNILGTGYDLEKDAPGQVCMPRTAPPPDVVTAARVMELVRLVDPVQLGRFGLNLNPTWDANTLSEKWESLAIIPLDDPAAPNDYLLLVGNDNDFLAPVTYHNGTPQITNEFVMDSIVLAFRIGEDHVPPLLVCPDPAVPALVAATADCALPDVTALVRATDNSAPPVALTQVPAVGSAVELGVPIEVTVSGQDAAGNAAAPCTFTVIVTDQTPPSLACPAEIVLDFENADGAAVQYEVTVSDNCSAPAVTCSPGPGVFPIGITSVACTSTDPAGNTAACQFNVTVLGPLEIKQTIDGQLPELLDDLTTKPAKHALQSAMRYLKRALDPALWIDSTHLQTPHGHRVFIEEVGAVHHLDRLITLDTVGPIVQTAIARLVAADRLLADVAIHNALAAGGNPAKIAEAQQNLMTGDAELAGGDCVHAILRYAQAWVSAQQAVK
ncbi:MAG: esterase-like activity of phytase family protein [Verrucomicrobia bacterium]|nr:esterase-like activity of phytase family protein [Verrucomicrobiota bacterium]